MKNIIKIPLLLLFLLSITTSCKNEKSLQAYLVESQEKKEFITVDIPKGFLQLKSQDVSEDVKVTLESIRKVNIVALPFEGNESAYEKEKVTLKKIFKDNKESKSLMSMKAKGMNVKLYYTGDTEAIDEVIAFGYGEEAGVGVARLLGSDMNPAKIIEMMDSLKIDFDSIDLNQFKTIFQKK
jgi:hypothetical protein